MDSALNGPINFKLVMQDSLATSYEFSNVLLARVGLDGTLHLLTSGWERVLGYRRGEFNDKTLLNLMWSNRGSAATAATSILDALDMGPVTVRLRCRDGSGKCFKLHRRYDLPAREMYIVAEEIAADPSPAPGEARGPGRASSSRRDRT